VLCHYVNEPRGNSAKKPSKRTPAGLTRWATKGKRTEQWEVVGKGGCDEDGGEWDAQQPHEGEPAPEKNEPLSRVYNKTTNKKRKGGGKKI